MSLVTKTMKIDYKLKDVEFKDGVCVNENGEIIDIVSDLAKLFNGKVFTLSATLTKKDEFDIKEISEK